MGYQSHTDRHLVSIYGPTCRDTQKALWMNYTLKVVVHVLQQEKHLNTTTSSAMTITANQVILTKLGKVNGTWMTLSGTEQGVQLETTVVPIADCRTSTGPSHVLPLTTLKSASVLTSLDPMKTSDLNNWNCMFARAETVLLSIGQ